jgi:hypothetical protein
MTSVAEKYDWMPQARYLGPARVLEVDEAGRRARLRLTGHPQESSASARIAISSYHSLNPGDLALIVGEELSDLYLIGVLNRENASDAPERKIALSGGTQAEAAGRPGEQTLRVFSPKQELLFEYDEKNGRARVNMEAGDIEFVTQKGSITFASGREILFHGKSIGLTSTRGVFLGVIDALGKLRSALTLQAGTAKVNSPEVGIEAQRGVFQVEDTRYTGQNLLSKIGQAKLKIDRVESAASTVIARAKNVFQTVEQLSQVKAGRMRTLVDKTFHFKSKKAYLKSEEDYKIKAEKIHLG